MKNSKIESKERESNRSSYDNRYDSRDDYKKKSKTKKKEYKMYDEKDKNKFKIKIYLTQKNNDESDDNDNVCHEKKLNYFDSDYDEIDDSKDTILVNNAAFIDIVYRRCHRNFLFNNQLHKHLRTDTYRKKASSIKANVFVINHNISLIRFKIDLNQDINIEYDFHEWQYCIAKVNLSLNSDLISFCLNIDADITLSNEVFFQK